MRNLLVLVTTIAFVVAGRGDAQTSQLTLPAGYAAVEGNSQTGFPVNTTDDQVWQWHYDASNFGALGPITITELAIRPKAGFGTNAWDFGDFTVTLIEARTDFTTSQHDVVFGENIMRSTRVRTGPWTGGPLIPLPGQTVGGWIAMGLTESFTYDPSLGHDLIVQVRKCNTNAPFGTNIDLASGSSAFVDGNRYGHTTDCDSPIQSFSNAYAVPVIRVSYTAARQTLPRGFDNVDGNYSATTHFTTTFDQKWQWHYDAGQFDAFGPIAITQLWVRADSPAASLAPFFFPDFRVVLGAGSTNYTFANHSLRFADNIEGQKVVRSGAWSGGPVGPSGGATADWVSLGLTEAFVYDPRNGEDFIVQFEYCGTPTPWNVSVDGVIAAAGAGGGNRYGSTASCTSLTYDLASSNDRVAIVRVDYEPVSSGLGAVRTYPFREDFESVSPGVLLPRGFVNVVGEAPDIPGDWIVSDMATLSLGTGPGADHSPDGVNFVYVEDSGSDNPTVAMDTPSFDLSGLAQPRLSFWIHSLSAGTDNSLSIDIVTLPSGPLVEDVAVYGALSADWEERTIDLTPWLNQTIQVRFSVDNDNLDFGHDIALDDLRVYDLTVQSGQAPTTLASLDASHALDANGRRVEPGVPGPYVASIFGGENIGLVVSGTPGQPFLLLSAPLLVGAATFGGIGQLDLDPNQLLILIDGVNGTGLIPGFFFTNASGSYTFDVASTLPPGLIVPLQAAVFTGGAFPVALSNALVIEAL